MTKIQGRQSRGGWVCRNPPPPKFWVLKLGGVKPPDFENIFLKIDPICYYVRRNSKKWTFYRVKILKCKPFLTALHRNSKKWSFSLSKILKSWPFNRFG